MSAAQPLPRVLNDEHRFDRGSWLTVALVVGLAAISAVVSALVVRLPSDGCVMSDYNTGAITPQIVAECYGDWATPLRRGDKVLAFGPVPVSNGYTSVLLEQATPPEWRIGATVEYTVQRDGATISLPVPINQLSWSGVARVFAYTLGLGPSGVANFVNEYLLYLSAVTIFVLAPRNAAARLLLLSFGSLFAATRLGSSGAPVSSAVIFTQGALFYAEFLIGTFWVWLYWPSLLLLLLSFPRRVWPVSRRPRVAPALIYGVPAAAILIALVLGNAIAYIVVLIAQFVLLLLALIAVPAHTFLRVRERVVRAQTGWMLLGLGCYIAPIAILYPLLIFAPELVGVDDSVPEFLLTIATGIGFPLCLGIAITRYRLFDITLVVRRTLVYAVLTLALGATYFISVVALQTIFVQLTGQQNTLAVVASTLAIAALFGPLRRRVQALIDRRFFRRKYDSQQVLAQFAMRAQQQADLDTLAGDILGVVRETVQPEDARIWLVPGKVQA